MAVFEQTGIHFELIASRVIKSKAKLTFSNDSLHLQLEDTGENIYIPLSAITNYQLIQPIFGANYLSAIWAGEGKFNLTFKEGGAATCFDILTKLIADHVTQNTFIHLPKTTHDKKKD